MFHTGRWPHDGVDFTGKRVAVIGTGSSGVQSIPIIARQARELVVFQRTATYSVPAYNAPLDEQEKRAIKADYGAFRALNSQSPTAIGSRLPMREEPALALARRTRARLRAALGTGRVAVPRRVPRSPPRPRRERHRRGVRARQDPRDREGSRRRRSTVAEDRHRLQAPVRRHRLLRDLQPRQRRARRRERGADLRDHAARSARRRPGVRVRLHRVRDRVRRDDGCAAEHRHSRSRRPHAPRRVGRGPAHVSRSQFAWVSRTSSRSPVRAARRC